MHSVFLPFVYLKVTYRDLISIVCSSLISKLLKFGPPEIDAKSQMTERDAKIPQ